MQYGLSQNISFITQSLISLRFLTFFIVFPNTESLINSIKSFPKSFLAFVLRSIIYLCRVPTMLLGWTQLLYVLFLVSIHRLVFPSGLLCVLRIFLAMQVTQKFLAFTNIYFSGKNGRSSCAFTKFLRIPSINFKYVSLVTVFIIASYEAFVEIKLVISPFRTIYRHILWHCQSIKIADIPVHEERWFWSFMRLSLAFAYQYMAWSIPPLILF